MREIQTDRPNQQQCPLKWSPDCCNLSIIVAYSNLRIFASTFLVNNHGTKFAYPAFTLVSILYQEDPTWQNAAFQGYLLNSLRVRRMSAKVPSIDSFKINKYFLKQVCNFSLSLWVLLKQWSSYFLVSLLKPYKI